MNLCKETIEKISKQYRNLRSDAILAEKCKMPGDAYFIDDNNILSFPRDDGDCRYPYGQDGFNFWTYTSGCMHSNEGLFSTFLRAIEGQEPKIAFFAGFPDGEDGYRPVSLLSVPILGTEQDAGIERYTVFSRDCAYYITEMKDLRFAIRVFSGENKDVYFTINVDNLGTTPQKLYISTYLNPFLAHRTVENSEYRWFREVRYVEGDEKSGDLGVFIIKVNEDLNRTTSLSNIGVISRSIELDNHSTLIRHEETASRYQYVGGSRSSLNSPFSLRKGSFGKGKHICAFTEVGAASDIVHIEIGCLETVRYEAQLRYMIHCADEKEADWLLGRHIKGSELDRVIGGLADNEKKFISGLSCTVANAKEGPVKGEVFNSFFEHLKKQVEFCSLIKGYIQLTEGSLIGIRDVFQAIEGMLFWNPEAARKKMLEALGFISPNGRCPRQYTLPVREGASPVMDLREFIDQGVWVISTVTTYLKLTGDNGFLKEECGYYEIVDEKKGLVRKSELKDSVLEHLIKIMHYLLGNRDFEGTGCIRVLYGDWNDALDGLGVSGDPGREFGSGVSVMASLQVYQNLREMIELLKWLDEEKYLSYVPEYNDAMTTLGESIKQFAVISGEKSERRIVHGWGDKRAYFVGGFDDPDRQSRLGLTSNAFWVLSGMYDADMGFRDIILDAFSKLDSKYGFKTFEPFFPANTPGVGRIPKLPPGTAENGAVYIHAATFAVMALFKMGCPREAWSQLYKLLPFTHAKVSCSPYVIPNSYGYNEDKLIDGESMVDWQTGSSNVVLKTLIRFVFGLEPEFEGIWIQPAGWIPFEGFSVNIAVNSCNVRIEYKNKCSGRRKYTVNGSVRKGIWCESMRLERLWIPRDELKNEGLEIVVEN